MSEIHIHHDRHIVFSYDPQHSLILVKAHHLLSELQRSADHKALTVSEPSAVVHLPHGSSYGHDVQITGLEEPDKSIILISLKEFANMVKLCSYKVHQTVHAAAYHSPAHLELLRIALYHSWLCDVVWQEWMFLIPEGLLLPSVISGK